MTQSARLFSSSYAILKLMRWPNLLMIAGGFFLMYRAVGSLDGHRAFSCLSFSSLGIAALCLSLAAAWGYVINDCRDVEADRINKKNRPLPRGKLSLMQAQSIARILLLLTLGISLIASILFFQTSFFLLIAIILLLEYLYTYHTRRLPLLGNILTALLVSSTVALPAWLYHSHCGQAAFLSSPYSLPIGIFGVFALLTTLAREQAKDMEDLTGDKSNGYASLPLKIGIAGARRVLRITLLLILLLIAALIPFLLRYQYSGLAIYASALLCLPLLWLVIRFPDHSGKAHPLSISASLKGIMLIGLISSLWL